MKLSRPPGWLGIGGIISEAEGCSPLGPSEALGQHPPAALQADSLLLLMGFNGLSSSSLCDLVFIKAGYRKAEQGQ